MGKIKGWRKSFGSPDRVEYRSTKDLFTPERDDIIPENTSVLIVKNFATNEWNSIINSESYDINSPKAYSIDGQTFPNKKSARDAIIDWIKKTDPVIDKPLSLYETTFMTITLSAYEYMDIVYLQGENNEGENFIRNVFVNGWCGVQKEYPTLDKIEWGFVTLEMFYITEEFVELSKFLDMPIVDHTIELSAPEYDPVRAKLESKVKIIWK